MKLGNHIESRPINILGVVALFFFILFAEALLGGIFYSQGLKYLGTNPEKASVIINGGLMVTKGLILFSLLRLVFYKTVTATESNAQSTLLSQRFPAEKKSSEWFKTLLYTGFILILYRMAFDSVLGVYLMKWFGISEDLKWSMEIILGAPVLGYGYILLIAPIFEEIIYRGIFYDGLRKHGYSVLLASGFSAILFAAMHLNIPQGANAFVLGLLTAFIYEQTRSLIVPIVFHILNNLYVTFFSSAIVSVQGFNLPIRLLVMGLSLSFLLFLLRRWSKEKAVQV